jgi:hypothetical protein
VLNHYAPFVAESGSWVEGAVDSSGEHIRLCFGGEWEPVALLAPTGEGRYAAEFLLDPAVSDEAAEAIREARRALDFYLVELDEPDPWAYAIYHCGTASNLYSPIHWEHHRPAQEDTGA